jgi:hypothetical protein
VEAKQELAALTQALAALILHIAEVADSARKEALAKLAREANVNIKTGNLIYATAGIESLRRALDQSPPPSGERKPVSPAMPTPVPPVPDAAALTRSLSDLVRRIAAVTDPTGKAALVQQVCEATGHLKTGARADATAAIEALRQALDGAPAAAGRGTADYPKAWAEAVGAWRKASEATDEQIAELQRKLRQTGDQQLRDIAEFGLNGITGGFKVKLLAMMQTGAPPDAGQAARALTILSGFQDHLARDRRVKACDANPWKVPVNLCGTLGAVLTQMEAALRLAPRL